MSGNLEEILEEILQCPKCGGELVANKDEQSRLKCGKCGESYPLIEGIPLFCREESKN